MLIVSGLPRSGTSMMMKMLADGGVPILTDQIRNADEDNPNGYYEFEPVKQLVDRQDKWLADGNGKAVKIISALLEYLPPEYHYKVIFMERAIKEILASQQKMLARRNENSGIEDAAMQAQFEQHLAAVKYWLARQPNIDVLYVEYNAMIVNPDAYCEQIAEFAGLPLDVGKMRSVPNGRLYRNRAS
ncbi:MAG: sulfotransferase [Anaerolineales bacterium]